ncbi:hypothetical protein HC928_19135 [bacterium]|nr:hypothetical protein [bacterium]
MLVGQQRIVITLWVGLPLLLLVIVLFINPAYSSRIFERSARCRACRCSWCWKC